ncbi:MAG: S26 family signal peptidase [Parvibaculum sp.]|nr:S26 family signal peptidase [Parvibaculum sp.]
MTARRFVLASTLAGVALIVLLAWTAHAPHLFWNASASTPIGLYRAMPAGRIEVGHLVVVTPPTDIAEMLHQRGYLPRGVQLIKRVLALPGTQVCRRGTTIVAYDHAYGEAREHDALGRDLPAWQGCRTLRPGEVFLMNWDAPDSLDGRYFGPLPSAIITARVIPVWTDEDGDGRFRWVSRRFAQEP